MVKRKVAALEKVEADFVSLQNKIRRDPQSYESEFQDQWHVYEAQKQIFLSGPTTANPDDVKQLQDLIDLIAHVAECYPVITNQFVEDLKAFLVQHDSLEPELREKVVTSLVLLRRKEVIDSSTLCQTLFPILVNTQSKTLRELCYGKIVMDLRRSNSKSINHTLNRTIQTVLHNLVTSDKTSAKGIWAIKITRELWKRQIWTTDKPVETMKFACLSDNEKVCVGGVRFFLGGDKEREEAEDESSDEENLDLKQMLHTKGINKKSKKRDEAYKKALSKVKRKEKKKNSETPLGNFSALHLLHDPQAFADELFSKHLKNTKSKFSLDSKLLILQLVSRLCGLEKLVLIPLFNWFTKFLTPKQQNVTSFLASLAQACHNLVPPEHIEPLVVKVANEFVSEGSSAEVAAAGINAIREICVRQPLAISETLLADLVGYQKSKDKGVVFAAKGLQSLYREVYPELLEKKRRGKTATMGIRSGDVKQLKFGESEVGGIEGLELLAKYKEEQKEQKRAEMAEKGEDEAKEGNSEDEDGWNSDDWEVASSDSDSSGGWIDVYHSSDEDEPVTKKQKKGSEAPDLVDENGDKAVVDAEAIAKLATTTLLTPADLAKLQELRREAEVNKTLGTGRSAKKKAEILARHIEDGVTAQDIEAAAQLGKKFTKEERVAMAQEGKPGRDEHKSTQAIRKSKKDAQGKSSTNKEKARRKNFLMTMGKAKAKNKRSLVETKKTLKAHIARSKSGGRRRNGM